MLLKARRKAFLVFWILWFLAGSSCAHHVLRMSCLKVHGQKQFDIGCIVSVTLNSLESFRVREVLVYSNILFPGKVPFHLQMESVRKSRSRAEKDSKPQR